MSTIAIMEEDDGGGNKKVVSDLSLSFLDGHIEEGRGFFTPVTRVEFGPIVIPTTATSTYRYDILPTIETHCCHLFVAFSLRNEQRHHAIDKIDR